MFCPKCATQNLENASYCRSCGANISLVPQALMGQVPQPPASDDPSMSRRRRRRNRNESISLDQAFKNIFMGIGFIIIAGALARSPVGQFWWYWMLIPAFSLMGTGIAQFIRLKEKGKQDAFGSPQMPQSFPDRQTPVDPTLIAPRTGELRGPVPSVTEGTTRHLGAEAPTRHIDNQDRR